MNSLAGNRCPESLRVPLPEGALDIPFPRDRVLHSEAGLYLDPLLRSMARASGAVDRTMALGLRRLREQRGYRRLGYARFADYARERLGMAVRTAQEMVRLGAGLERLPLLDAALAAGRVTWTAALQVARVAGPDDQAQWVSLAERLSVRELQDKVTQALAGSVDADRRESDRSAHAGGDSNHSGGDSNHSGGDSNNDKAIAPPAEDDDSLKRLSVRCAWSVARLWHAAVELCEIVVGGPMAEGEAPEYVLSECLSGLPCVPREGNAPYCPPPPLAISHGSDRFPGCGARPVAPLAEQLGGRALSAEQCRRIERTLALVNQEIPGDPLEIDRSLRDLIRARVDLELDLARLLRNFQAYGLARHLGFPTFKEYVAERLGISVDRARFLVRLDNRLIQFAEVRRAVRRGEIGTVAALLVCRIASPDLTETAWIERARKRTIIRLKQEVEWAEREMGRSWIRNVLPPPPGRLPSPLDAVTADVVATRDATTVERSDAADPVAGHAAPDETFAHPVHEGRPVRVEFRLRESVLELWQEVKRRLCAVSGEPGMSDEQVLYEAARAFMKTYLPLWIGEVQHGDPIAVRDRFHCLVPGCTNRCGSGHHIRYRSKGGPDEAWNLAFLCHTHHLDLLHQQGFIRVRGRAPDDLVFELGIRPDGTATEVFVNEDRIDGRSIQGPG